MHKQSLLAVLLTTLFALVCADTQTCGNGKTCPEDSPCCSQYGECGTGLYCLGACDPLYSFNSSACVPMPVCKSTDSTFSSLDRVIDQTKYLGDADKYDWVTNGKVVNYKDNLLLTMANQSYGTVLSSTRYIWYGKVSATLTTSHGAGVVSAFILMSGSKDEIDYEFVGNDVTEAQTNFYYEGVLNYTNSIKAALSATNESSHTYEFDWTEDQITWSIDGQVARILKKADTFNSTTKEYMFPQTPSIVQFSLWPGGSDKNAEGTVQWAGGPIDWSMPEFKDPGYLYTTLEEIKIDCYDAPDGTDKSGSNAYIWDGKGVTQGDVKITDDKYVLGSFDAVGFDMGKGNSSNIKTASEVATNIGQGNQHATGSIQGASAVSESSTKTSSKATSTKSVANASQASESSSASAKTTASSDSGSGSGSDSSSAGSDGSSATDTDAVLGQGSSASSSSAKNGAVGHAGTSLLYTLGSSLTALFFSLV